MYSTHTHPPPLYSWKHHLKLFGLSGAVEPGKKRVTKSVNESLNNDGVCRAAPAFAQVNISKLPISRIPDAMDIVIRGSGFRLLGSWPGFVSWQIKGKRLNVRSGLALND